MVATAIITSVDLALPDDMPYRPRFVMTASAAEPTGAALLARSVCRTLEQLGYVSLVEFPLANGRRADILALGRTGDLVIVEIKSSVADFRADRKWSAYRDFSDRLYFAVPNDFPRPLIPDECGLMVADSFSAAVLRDGSTSRLDAGRRRALTTRFARIAATRLRRLLDPEVGRLGGM
ncbi:MAG TPA: MmcB family DNA repair protein [Stellaceae bacterium]|nr:MmcB family DNA repair protein [Stellaceae bacterium]